MDEQKDLETRLQMNLFYGSFFKSLFTMFEVLGFWSRESRARFLGFYFYYVRFEQSRVTSTPSDPHVSTFNVNKEP